MVWPWAYSAWQVGGFELAHFLLSFCVVFVAVSPVVYLTWITYRTSSDGDSPYLSSPWRPMLSARAVIYMVLLSLSVGLVAHVLEDIFLRLF
jgi:hypothetical protein